jgi:hypothetical protein
MLAAGNFPRHRTICDFRAFHLKELSELFVQVVKLAREMGLVKLGTVAIDGTKVKANASRHKAMSYERMNQAEANSRRRSTRCWRAPRPPTRPRSTSPSWTCPPRSNGARRG